MKIEMTEPLLLTLAGFVLWLVCTLIWLFVVDLLLALLLGFFAPAVGIGIVYAFLEVRDRRQ